MSQLESYTVDPVFGCWIWTGKLDRNDGRPLVWRGRRPSAAHRAMYEHHIGPIPDGLELDHTCQNTLCVRPAHMEPVTRPVNEQRKSTRVRMRIKACKNGHDMKLNAMVTPSGGRCCRTCSRSEAP